MLCLLKSNPYLEYMFPSARFYFQPMAQYTSQHGAGKKKWFLLILLRIIYFISLGDNVSGPNSLSWNFKH